MSNSIERRQNGPTVEAQAARPAIIEGPRMYVGGGKWAPVELPPLVEKLSKPQRGEILDPHTFDGVETDSYTASWGNEDLADLFAETEERTALDRAAARLALDESARERRKEAREVRIGRVARRLHKTPDDLTEMLGEAKAVKWATGASKGKISRTRPSIDEKRGLGESTSSREYLAASSNKGSVVEALSPEEFRHLTVGDQIERMWDVYEAEGRAVNLQVPVNIPGLDTPKMHTEKERRALERRGMFSGGAVLKDQDPDRSRRSERIGPNRIIVQDLVWKEGGRGYGWKGRWIEAVPTFVPWRPRPTILETDHKANSAEGVVDERDLQPEDPADRWRTEDGTLLFDGMHTNGVVVWQGLGDDLRPDSRHEVAPIGFKRRQRVSAEAQVRKEMTDGTDGLEAFEAGITALDHRE